MADVEIKKKRTFRKFTYRGVDLDQLLDMSYEQLMQLYCARQRRRLNRGLRRKQQSLLKRLRKAKKEAPPMEKPEVVKTHLRDMVILPEMVGSMVGVYNGKTFNQVEIKVRLWERSMGRLGRFPDCHTFIPTLCCPGRFGNTDTEHKGYYFGGSRWGSGLAAHNLAQRLPGLVWHCK
uniref:40S ribosomal protein S15 n=1 Tax=Oncorhynchus tshawytscha TaxID=74940 RepID=A0AAZ3RIV7_ONCTS